MNQRRYDLDWMRVLAFSLLILFHTGMMFNTWSWHIKNTETSQVFNHVMRFLHLWRMPLLFFISGSAIWFLLGRRSPARYVAERCRRLLVPLIFGMLVIIPPQVYHERLFQQQTFSSFWDFYRTVLTLTPYPQGNFSWHHLWYIPYIFVYSLLLLPLFLFLRRTRGKKILAQLHHLLDTPWIIPMIAVPNILGDILLRPFWPSDTHDLLADWANFVSTILIFSIGYILAEGHAVWDRMEKQRMAFLGWALVLYGLLALVWEIGWLSHAGWVKTSLYYCLTNTCGWLWLLTILGYGKRYLSFSNRFLTYANEAVYPFYQVHQTITVVLGFYLIAWPVPIVVKFPVVAGGTFLGSWLVFAVIRRYDATRFLFGMRRKPATDEYQEVPRKAGVRSQKSESRMGRVTYG